VEFLHGMGMCFPKTMATGERQTVRTLKQQLQDVSTEIVVEKLFGPAADRTFIDTYVSAFVRCYDDCVRRLVQRIPELSPSDMVLVYKGGNVLVDYFQTLLGINLINPTQRLVRLLKRSDTDFTVVLSAKGDVHRHEVNQTIVMSLYMFRQWLVKNGVALPSSGDYLRGKGMYDNVLQGTGIKVVRMDVRPRPDLLILDPRKDLMTKVVQRSLLAKVPRSGRYRDSNGRFAAPSVAAIQEDVKSSCGMFVVPQSPVLGEDWTGAVSAPRHESMYVTFNDTLMFEVGNNGVGHFDLARLKTNVALGLSSGECVQAPAELIDVSISHKDDSKRIMDHGVEAWTMNVTLVGRGENATTVVVPKLSYLVNSDIYTILFADSEFPWDDIKYEKRMTRYIVGAAIDVAFALEGREPTPRVPTRSAKGFYKNAARMLDLLNALQVELSVLERGRSGRRTAKGLHPTFDNILRTFKAVAYKVSARNDVVLKTRFDTMIHLAIVVVGDLINIWNTIKLDMVLNERTRSFSSSTPEHVFHKGGFSRGGKVRNGARK
jgi:hypothetical protein